MSTNFQKFKSLHTTSELLFLPNAWDARSAILFQEYGFPAVATSSAAVANSLGYEDGENMSFVDYMFVIRRILSSITVPLTVDIETGYGDDNEEVANNVVWLAEHGVAGINIEDSLIDGSHRFLKDPVDFSNRIRFIKEKLKSKDLDIFINIRCDTHILNVADKQRETMSRVKIYNTSGADGIFIPCIHEKNDITEVVTHSTLPLNVMCIPGLPDLDALLKLGVKRVTMGPFLFQKVYEGIGKLSQAVISSGSFSPILP
jgi:2-methylisocitrate lyase-like PEP mutase family enzyme